jgi:hypothetical protein
MTDYAPIARIILRYVIGAVFMGSDQIGAQFAADPDAVMVAAVAVGAVVEAAYAIAKRKGWAT